MNRDYTRIVQGCSNSKISDLVLKKTVIAAYMAVTKQTNARPPSANTISRVLGSVLLVSDVVLASTIPVVVLGLV